MHELGVAQDILAALRPAIAGRPGFKVRRVRVKYGKLRGVEPEALKFAYEAICKGEPAVEGSVLELEEDPVVFHCRDCGKSLPLADWAFQCSSCGSVYGETTGGNEIVLESLEGEEAP